MTGQRIPGTKATKTSEEEALVPQNLAGAQLGLDGLLREKAIVEGLVTLNRTWETADVPEGGNTVDSKWIFWVTKDPVASLVCCKDQLVALFNVFAPDTHLSSICAMLAAGAAWDYISQIDIEGTYPNEILTVDETTPPGLSIPSPFGKIFVDNWPVVLKTAEQWGTVGLIRAYRAEYLSYQPGSGLIGKLASTGSRKNSER